MRQVGLASSPASFRGGAVTLLTCLALAIGALGLRPAAAVAAATAPPSAPPAPSGEVRAFAGAHDPGARPAEPAAEPAAPRTEYWTPSSHSVTEGGQTTLELYAAPAFVRESSGWREVDDAITEGTEFPLEALGLVTPVRFGTTAEQLVGFDTLGGRIWLGLEGASVTRPVLHGDVVTYADVFPGVDLELRTAGGRLGKHLVLADEDAPHSFRFSLSDPGHTLGAPVEGDDESWSFESAVAFATGMALPAPAAWAQRDTIGLPGSAHQDVRVTDAGYVIDLGVDPLWAEGARYPLVLDPAVEWTDETWSDDDGLAVAFAPSGADACDGDPCLLADPVDGRVRYGEVYDDDPVAAPRHHVAYVGADVSVLAGRQVTSALLGGYDYYTGPSVWPLCGAIGPGATGADVIGLRCADAADVEVGWRMEPPYFFWSADVTRVVRSAVRGGGPAGTVAGFAVDQGLDPVYTRTEIAAPALRLVYSGYPAPRPLTVGQTFGCACWTGGSTSNQALAADPVNTATGALMEHFSDLGLAGPGVPLEMTRTYNSLDNASGAFGPGWSFAYGARLDVGPTGEVVLTDGSGTRTRFGPLPGGGYAPIDAAVTASLQDGPGGARVLRDLAGVTTTFDAAGRLVGRVDERGQGVTLAYSGDALTTVTDATGQTFAMAWVGSGASARIASVTSSDGRSVSYGYATVAGARRLTQLTDVAGGVTSYSYGPDGRLNGITDPLGHVSARTTYGADGRVTEQRDETGASTTFAWDAATQTAVVTDPTGRTRTDVYNGLNLVRQVDGNGAVTEQLHDANNNRAASVDADDRLYREDYDDRNRLVQRVSSAPLFAAESWTYDDADRVTSHTDADGLVTTYEYDAAGLLTTVTTPDGGTTTYTYTDGTSGAPAHLLASSTDALGRTTTHTYDAVGNRTSTTTPGGGTSSATYDTARRLLTSTTPGGATTSYTYDAAGRPLTVTDPTGAVTTNVYDAGGRLTRSTDAMGRETRYWYDAADRPVRVRDAAGGETLTSYDDAGRVATVTDAAGSVVSYEYDDAGRLVSTTDPLGHVTSRVYDAVGNLTAVTDATGATTSSTYDVLGRVVSTTDPDGVVTETVYDRRGNVQEVRDGAGNTTTTVYDVMNRPVAAYDPDGVFTGFTYDAAGQLVEQSRYRSSDHYVPGYWEDRTTFTYDADGRRTATVEARGNVPGASPASYTTSVQYDADGRPVATTDPLGRTSSTTYDAAGRPVATVDTSGGTTTTAYDATGLPTSVTAPDGAETAYGYDAAGRVAERVDPLGRSTGYAYDAVGRVVAQTDPLGRVTRTTYDAAGNVATIVRPSGTQTTGDPDDGTITFDHDEAGRVTARSFSDGTAAFGYEYSAAGRLVTASRTAGGTVTSVTTYGYDELGRTVSAERTGPGAVAAAYSYTSAGRLAGAAWSTGQSVSYSYNQVGQLVEVVPEGSGGLTPVNYAYDAAGNRVATHMTGAPSSGTQVVYDLAGQVSTVKHAVGASTTLRYDLVRDVRGNPTLVTEQADGVVTRTAYEYDGVGRLTAQCSPAIGSSGGCAGLVPGSWFSYDQMGNRTSETVRSGFGQWAGVVRTDSVYDEADQLVSQSVGAVQVASFGWSPEGALVSSSSAAGDRSWVSDLSGELVSVVLEDGRVVGFEHDGEGNRVARSVDGVVDASWAWDSTVAGVPVRVGQSAPGGGVVSWLPDVLSGVGAPLAQVSVAGAGSWLLADPFSSVVASVPAGSGVVAGSARFDAFGVPVVPASGALVGQGVGFAGQYLDGVVGAYDMRARDYVASWGRFTSADPVAVPVGMGMVNGYGYAFGNPLVLHDVTGNWPSCDELWGLCDSPTFFWNEVVGFGQGAVGTVDALVHPLRTHRLMVDACNAGFDQWSGGAGLTWEGGAQCVDNLNPFAQIRRDVSSSLRSGCVEESGQAFGRALFGAAATAAPFVKAAPAAIDGARNGAGWWNRTNTGPPAANTGSGVAAAVPGPNFIVRPNGETVIVPQGASGPVPARGDGFRFTGGRGGRGLHPSVSDVRIMDPVVGGKHPYPNGYASYLNPAGQTVNPLTGQTVGKSSPWWHWGFE